jgi:hypothetical protein
MGSTIAVGSVIILMLSGFIVLPKLDNVLLLLALPVTQFLSRSELPVGPVGEEIPPSLRSAVGKKSPHSNSNASGRRRTSGVSRTLTIKPPVAPPRNTEPLGMASNMPAGAKMSGSESVSPKSSSSAYSEATSSTPATGRPPESNRGNVQTPPKQGSRGPNQSFGSQAGLKPTVPPMVDVTLDTTALPLSGSLKQGDSVLFVWTCSHPTPCRVAWFDFFDGKVWRGSREGPRFTFDKPARGDYDGDWLSALCAAYTATIIAIYRRL